jgi:hypothetical protein
LDRATRAYYEKAFQVGFLTKRNTGFQDWFADIMEMRYPGGDFMRVRPWGKRGDEKNDGYLRSTRTLFQVYAPNTMKEKEAITKIDEDFRGALPHWEPYFRTWVFVHNAIEGLGPGITKKLLELDAEQEPVNVTHWGFNDFRRVFFKLDDADIAAVLGPAPTTRDFLELGFDNLIPVIDTIKRAKAPACASLTPVPRDKIEINHLSDEVEGLIEMGRRKSPLVGDYFRRHRDPGYGDEVAEAFQSKYEELKSDGLEPDWVFVQLQIFAGGDLMQDPKHQAAVLAVLAYLFDQCDIFEGAGEAQE